MLIRTEDFTDLNNLTKGSHKKIWFTCDNCCIGILQIYKIYIKQKSGKFCRSCRNKHSAANPDVKRKQSIASKKMWKNPEFRNHMKSVLSKACKKSWNENSKRKEWLSKNNPMNNVGIRKNLSKMFKGENGPYWKGGYFSNNIPVYKKYAYKISYAEKVRKNPKDKNILEIKCTYCGKWYIPTLSSIYKRISALNGLTPGEHRLYCSENCKQECPIYYKHKYSAEENNTKQYSREVQPELRQLVFKRDNYTCQKCGNSGYSLHCHHFEGIEINPIESADIDNCITLCKYCHKDIHKNPCPIKEYKRKKCK